MSAAAAIPPIPSFPPESPAAPPLKARRLAYVGLLPFVLGALLVWLVRADALPYAEAALSAYAALTLSFLGGIHWGIALRGAGPTRFGWGVVPALVAWPAALMPAYAGLVVHGAMLIVCYLVDRKAYPAQGLSAWLTLRFRLSAVAALCCFIAAAGT
jgi:Protein of unknown function (DUF3429)